MSMPAPHIEETVARGQESGSLSSVASADPSPAGGGHAFISTGDQSGHHIYHALALCSSLWVSLNYVYHSSVFFFAVHDH